MWSNFSLNINLLQCTVSQKTSLTSLSSLSPTVWRTRYVSSERGRGSHKPTTTGLMSNKLWSACHAFSCLCDAFVSSASSPILSHCLFFYSVCARSPWQKRKVRILCVILWQLSRSQYHSDLWHSAAVYVFFFLTTDFLRYTLFLQMHGLQYPLSPDAILLVGLWLIKGYMRVVFKLCVYLNKTKNIFFIIYEVFLHLPELYCTEGNATVRGHVHT